MSDEEMQIKFGADVGQAIAGTQQVKDSLSEVSDQVDKAERLFQYLGERMAEVFALHEIADFPERISEIGEQIERMSAMTGLSNEAVQTLGFAMERTGGNADSAGMMMTRFERNVEEAAGGSGKAYQAFEKLGVSLHDLQHMPIEPLLQKTAQGFRDLQDPVERAAIATEIGGRGFANLLPALMESSQGFEEFHEKLVALNDDLSDQTVKKLAETHEKITDLGRAAQGAGVQGMLLFKGSIDGLVEDFTAAIVDIGEFAAKLRELQIIAGDDMVKAFGLMVRAVDDMTAETGYAIDKLIVRWKEMGAIISEVATLHWSEIASVQTEANAEIAEAAKKAMMAIEQYQKDYDLLAASADKAASAINVADNAANKAPQSTNANRTGLLGDKPDVKAGDAAFLDAMRQNMNMIHEVEKENQIAAHKYKEQWQSTFSAVDHAVNSTLDGFLTGTETMQQALVKGFDTLALSAVNALADIIAEFLVFEAITSITGAPGSWSDFMALRKGGEGGVGTQLGNLAHFDVGTSYVPSTGLAMIHQGEIILPPNISAQVRSGQASIGAGGSLSSSTSNVNLSVSAIDAKSFINLINNPSITRQMAKNMSAYQANNPSTRGSY